MEPLARAQGMDEAGEYSELEDGEIVDDNEDAGLLDEDVAHLSPEDATEALKMGALLELLMGNETLLDLTEGLTFEGAAKELEQRLQKLADGGDLLLQRIRKIASKIKEMPMTPVLAMLRVQADFLLRLRRANVSTSSSKDDKSTPFRGYSADVRAFFPSRPAFDHCDHCIASLLCRVALLRCTHSVSHYLLACWHSSAMRAGPLGARSLTTWLRIDITN